jgi:hypothetical protein
VSGGRGISALNTEFTVVWEWSCSSTDESGLYLDIRVVYDHDGDMSFCKGGDCKGETKGNFGELWRTGHWTG